MCVFGSKYIKNDVFYDDGQVYNGTKYEDVFPLAELSLTEAANVEPQNRINTNEPTAAAAAAAASAAAAAAAAAEVGGLLFALVFRCTRLYNPLGGALIVITVVLLKSGQLERS